MEYVKLEKANNEINTMDIKGKEYCPVNERIIAFKKVYPEGRILTEIIREDDESILMKASIFDEDKMLSTGHASETKKSGVNSISMLENCETSAVGRALGMAGFGIKTGIATEQDMQKVEEFNLKNKKIEIFDKIYISESDAIKIIKTSVNDLIRKQGIVISDLKKAIRNLLWTELEDLNYQQLGVLEKKLTTVNNTKSDWHNLYAQNSNIKDVVNENVEVIYASSLYRFGKLALKRFENDELKQGEVIDYYLNTGVDLRKDL